MVFNTTEGILYAATSDTRSEWEARPKAASRADSRISKIPFWEVRVTSLLAAHVNIVDESAMVCEFMRKSSVKLHGAALEMANCENRSWEDCFGLRKGPRNPAERTAGLCQKSGPPSKQLRPHTT